jgi:hypothetical protein
VEPLLLLLAEVWWVAPAAVGAGALGWVGVRVQRGSRARHLELDAARADVRTSRQALSASRAGVHAARAEVARAEADRLSARAGVHDVATARRRLQEAQGQVRAASADLTARRASVRAARAALPAPRAGRDTLPLARLMAAHDQLTSAWMAYETDPAKAIAYPSMSDVQAPLTAAFLREQQSAQWLRPSSRDARISPADFAAYRDAVARARRAFDAAERDARTRAGEATTGDGRTEWWSGVAQDLVDGALRSAEAVARAASAAAWNNPKRPPTG